MFQRCGTLPIFFSLHTRNRIENPFRLLEAVSWGKKEKIKKPKLPCGCVCVMCPLDVDYEPISLFVPTGSIYLRPATIHLLVHVSSGALGSTPRKKANKKISVLSGHQDNFIARAEMLRLVTPRQPLAGPTLPPWHGLLVVFVRF